MSQEVIYAKDQEFHLLWDWYQPQMSAIYLMRGTQRLLKIEDGQKDDARRLCDMLNLLYDEAVKAQQV